MLSKSNILIIFIVIILIAFIAACYSALVDPHIFTILSQFTSFQTLDKKAITYILVWMVVASFIAALLVFTLMVKIIAKLLKFNNKNYIK